jgi:multiple sugar transport system substrate-binding protein
VGKCQPGTRILGAAVAVVALFLGGVACGSDSSSGAGSTLEMWTFKQAHVKPLQDAAASFKEKTGITVNVTAYTPDDAFKSKIQSAAASKNVADVLEVHAAGEDFVLGGSGILADLSSVVTPEWKSRFLKGTADAGLVAEDRYQRSLKPKAPDAGIKTGQYFSVPLTAGTFGIVYANKSKLVAAGLDPAKPPTTWSEFINWLKIVNAKDPQTGGLTLGLKAPTTGFNWALQPLTFGLLGKEKYQALFGNDPARSWASPDGQRALALYDQLTPYWSPGTQTLGIDDADRAFAQGKAAFDIGGTFTLAAFQQNGMNPGDVVAFGLPAAEGSVAGPLKLAPLALTGLAVSAQTKKQDDAIKWLDYLTSVEQAGAFAQASLDLPGTDLGADASRLLGPDLTTLQNVFGDAAAGAYDPADVTFFSPAYEDKLAGEALVRMSPLKESTPASLSQELGTMIATSWK